MGAVLSSSPNKLAFPGGSPGFDFSHPAAKNPRLSAVASISGGSFVDLLRAKTPALSNAPTSALYGGLGPTYVNASSQQATIPGPAVTDTNVTLAAIVVSTSSAAANRDIVFTNTGVGGGSIMRLTNGTALHYVAPNVLDVDTTLTISINTPYFLAVSNDTSKVRAVALNLSTGKLTSSSVSGTTPQVSGASYTFGNSGANAAPFIGNIAAAMVSGVALSLPQLIAFAQDPWSFWYPKKIDLGLMIKPSVVTFLAAWARGSNLPVIGTGNY